MCDSIINLNNLLFLVLDHALLATKITVALDSVHGWGECLFLLLLHQKVLYLVVTILTRFLLLDGEVFLCSSSSPDFCFCMKLTHDEGNRLNNLQWSNERLQILSVSIFDIRVLNLLLIASVKLCGLFSFYGAHVDALGWREVSAVKWRSKYFGLNITLLVFNIQVSMLLRRHKQLCNRGLYRRFRFIKLYFCGCINLFSELI